MLLLIPITLLFKSLPELVRQLEQAPGHVALAPLLPLRQALLHLDHEGSVGLQQLLRLQQAGSVREVAGQSGGLE